MHFKRFYSVISVFISNCMVICWGIIGGFKFPNFPFFAGVALSRSIQCNFLISETTTMKRKQTKIKTVGRSRVVEPLLVTFNLNELETLLFVRQCEWKQRVMGFMNDEILELANDFLHIWRFGTK